MAIVEIDLGLQGIKAGMTNRLDGFSLPPYDGYNLATHVGDDLDLVTRNRHHFYSHLPDDLRFQWLNQTHSNLCVPFTGDDAICADAIFSTQPRQVCLVQTADCLPILITDGDKVTAIHAGWRGVLGGVIENTLAHFSRPITAYLGVAISQTHFEVGSEVRDAFLEKDHTHALCFLAKGEGKYWCDLKGIARKIIQATLSCHIIEASDCSFANHDYYSYRRDGITGRMATFIYKE